MFEETNQVDYLYSFESVAVLPPEAQSDNAFIIQNSHEKSAQKRPLIQHRYDQGGESNERSFDLGQNDELIHVFNSLTVRARNLHAHRTTSPNMLSVNDFQSSRLLPSNEIAFQKKCPISTISIPAVSHPSPTLANLNAFNPSLDLSSGRFHWKTNLPLNSSPVPTKCPNSSSFDFDETLVLHRKSNNRKKSLSATHEIHSSETPDSGHPSSGGRSRKRPTSLALIADFTDSLSCVRNSAKKLSFSNMVSGSFVNSILDMTPQALTSQQLLVNFEESMLNGRIHPSGVVDGFALEIGASGSFFPSHLKLPVNAYFFHLSDDNAPSPYLGHVDLGCISNKRGYHIPKSGLIQLTLFNPSRSVVKVFVIHYNLEEMPANCQTFLRQRTVYMPAKCVGQHPSCKNEEIRPQTVDLSAEIFFSAGAASAEENGCSLNKYKSNCNRKISGNCPKICRSACSPRLPGLSSMRMQIYLRYLVHLRFQTTKSGNLYLHRDIRLIFARDNFEYDSRIAKYEIHTFIDAPSDPRFSTKKL